MSLNLTNAAMISCDSNRGCRAFVDDVSSEEWQAVGSPKRVSDLEITRRVAHSKGWVTGVSQARRGARRLDFCPEHATEATA